MPRRESSLSFSLSKNALISMQIGKSMEIVFFCSSGLSTSTLIFNTNCGTMGYDVPAALGAAVAAGRTVYCMTGDGSIMMNIQELQTIAHNRLPVKIWIYLFTRIKSLLVYRKLFFQLPAIMLPSVLHGRRQHYDEYTGTADNRA